MGKCVCVAYSWVFTHGQRGWNRRAVGDPLRSPSGHPPPWWAVPAFCISLLEGTLGEERACLSGEQDRCSMQLTVLKQLGVGTDGQILGPLAP